VLNIQELLQKQINTLAEISSQKTKYRPIEIKDGQFYEWMFPVDVRNLQSYWT
jgi:hypothetical protein